MRLGEARPESVSGRVGFRLDDHAIRLKMTYLNLNSVKVFNPSSFIFLEKFG